MLGPNMELSRGNGEVPPGDHSDNFGLDLANSDSHSFIARIWIEETVEEAGRVVWRGTITHIPGGERRYIQDLHDIEQFIAPYLEQMGVRFGFRRQADNMRNRLSVAMARHFSRKK
jgi:hypothetical protein